MGARRVTVAGAPLDRGIRPHRSMSLLFGHAELLILPVRLDQLVAHPPHVDDEVVARPRSSFCRSRETCESSVRVRVNER